MKYKFFCIPARDPTQAEADLNAFCTGHRVGFVEKQLIAAGLDSFWSVCVSWEDGEGAPSAPADSRQKPLVDYRKVFDDADFSRYLDLKNFRKALAEQQNVPPYALFTNDHLAEMIKQRMNNLAGLESIAGVGKARLDKYCDEFVQKLNDLWANAGFLGEGQHAQGSNQP